MRYGLAFILLVGTLAGSLAWPQTAPTATTKKAAAKKAAAKKSAKSAKTVRSPKAGKSGRSTRRSVTPARQMAPTPERYKEIQQALVDKGYLKSAPSGVWDADSIDAMTRFQNDQKLPATGKLTAASLIKLGLGPSTANTGAGLTGAESAAETGAAPPTGAPHSGSAPATTGPQTSGAN